MVNIVRFVLDLDFPQDYLTDLVDQLKKNNCKRVTVESISGDGCDYDQLIVERENHLSLNGGTACKIEYEPTVPVDEYADWICEIVDNVM